MKKSGVSILLVPAIFLFLGCATAPTLEQQYEVELEELRIKYSDDLSKITTKEKSDLLKYVSDYRKGAIKFCGEELEKQKKRFF